MFWEAAATQAGAQQALLQCQAKAWVVARCWTCWPAVATGLQQLQQATVPGVRLRWWAVRRDLPCELVRQIVPLDQTAACPPAGCWLGACWEFQHHRGRAHRRQAAWGGGLPGAGLLVLGAGTSLQNQLQAGHWPLPKWVGKEEEQVQAKPCGLQSTGLG